MSRIIVVGGGIGGLAAAVALAHRGHRCVVLERAGRFAEIGAGIQIAPNGLHALDRLGLAAGVPGIAQYMEALRFMDGLTGELVASVPLTGEYERRFGYRYAVVHRADLHGLLLKAALASGRVELRANSAVSGYRVGADGGASVQLESGESVHAEAVIGADGIHSAVRRQLVADGEPCNSGITVFRAVVPMDQVPQQLRFQTQVTAWAAPSCHLVHYPIAGGRTLNLAVSKQNDETRLLAGEPVSKERIRTEFSVFCDTARQLLELGEGWKSWVLIHRTPVDRWSDGPVVLLGDAAHAALHYAAQGACQALEDAVLLADLLDQAAPEDFPERFEQYTALRRDRTARVHALALDSIRMWHPAGQAAAARNARMSAMTATDLHDFLAWMHEPQSLSRV